MIYILIILMFTTAASDILTLLLLCSGGFLDKTTFFFIIPKWASLLFVKKIHYTAKPGSKSSSGKQLYLKSLNTRIKVGERKGLEDALRACFSMNQLKFTRLRLKYY